MIAHACNCGTREEGAKKSRSSSHPWLHSKSRPSWATWDPIFSKEHDTWNRPSKLPGSKEKTNSRVKKAPSRINVTMFPQRPHVSTRPEARTQVSDQNAVYRPLSFGWWALVFNVRSESMPTKQTTLAGTTNIRSVILEEGPMCPHTHPHKPPGGRSPLQTQQLTGKLLKIMPPGRACIPRSLGGVFFF